MPSQKVHQVAKDLNTSSKDVITRLQDLGFFEITPHMDPVLADALEALATMPELTADALAKKMGIPTRALIEAMGATDIDRVRELLYA